MKLELGCGIRPTAGYLHHDRIQHDPFIDFSHDLDKFPWPWEDSSCTEIVAIDVVEHLSSDVRLWLGECWRILVTGGLLKLRVPHWQHENAFTDPTHRRFFTPRTFDYWDPDTEFYRLYGAYDHASGGHCFSVDKVTENTDEGTIFFELRKLPLQKERAKCSG